jgi:1,2-diacylglycerol 3-beta-glucosyltransferase
VRRAGAKRTGAKRAPRRARLAAGLAAATAALPAAYVGALALAAAPARRRPAPRPPASGAEPRLLVLVPAHDEQDVIGDALDALAAADYPADRLDVVVVADNCGDATADVARRHGATVLERRDPERRGKGHALEWALGRVRDRAFDAVLFLDADCVVTPGLPRALAARLAAGEQAVQANYVVANPGDSPAAGLRYAAFAVICTVRPLGKDALGLSAGILGTGMALSRDLLDRHPWQAHSLAEDLEYHLRLIDSGERVRFVPEEAVVSPMPASHGDSAGQQSRWEAGRLELARRWAPRLVASGLRRRDPVRLHAALELLVPSQSALFALNAAALAAAAAAGGRATRAAALVGAAAQGAVVIGALRMVRAPRSAYASLLAAPGLVVRKLGLYGAIAAGRGPSGWERTAREPVSQAGGRR